MAKEDCDKSTAPVSCQAFSWTLLWRFRLTFSYLCLLKYPRLHGLRGHTLHLHHLSSSSLSLLTHGLLLLEPAGTAVLGDPFQPAKEEQADTPAPITFFSLYHGNCLPPPPPPSFLIILNQDPKFLGLLWLGWEDSGFPPPRLLPPNYKQEIHRREIYG